MKAFAVVTMLALAAPAWAGGTALDMTIGGRTVVQTKTDTSGGLLSFLFGGKESRSYTYSWPGVYFEANFAGDEVEAKVDDEHDDLYLIVDGVHKLTLTKPGKASVVLKDLGEGRHTVRLEKVSETQWASGTFKGFFVPSASDALPPPSYAHSIEFIGDSFTVGYGDVSRGQTCTTADVAETTDTSRAFAPLTAKRLKAGYRIIASSGHGIVRNYDNFDPGKTMPFLYDYALYDLKDKADDAGWNPDAIVIYLGTNDFSTPLKDGEPWASRDDLHADFVKKYVAFVLRLHEAHPNAHVLLMATVLASDNLANAVDANEMMEQVKAVGDGLTAAGFSDFEIVPVAGLDFQACHGHPSLKDEAILTQLLFDRLSKLPAFSGS